MVVFKLGLLSASLPDGNAPVLKLDNFDTWAKRVGAVINTVIFLMIVLLNAMGREALRLFFFWITAKRKRHYCFKLTTHRFSI